MDTKNEPNVPNKSPVSLSTMGKHGPTVREHCALDDTAVRAMLARMMAKTLGVLTTVPAVDINHPYEKTNDGVYDVMCLLFLDQMRGSNKNRLSFHNRSATLRLYMLCSIILLSVELQLRDVTDIYSRSHLKRNLVNVSK